MDQRKNHISIPNHSYGFSSVCILLVLTFLLFVAGNVSAQPAYNTDSLITEKSAFGKNERIYFLAKFNKNYTGQPDHVRLVSTISCSCGNTDFYYRVYRMEETDDIVDNWKLFISHVEKADAKKCECKAPYAEFYDGKKYSIPPLTKSGSYIIIINERDFKMTSNVFTITE
jgi:hypothetical protein